MATKYKIGDKVVLTSVNGFDKYFGLRIGMEGTIMKIMHGEAFVSFDGWHRGHTTKKRDCWIVILE